MGTATAAAAVATRSVRVALRSSSTPATTGPASRPNEDTKFTMARADTDDPEPRTTWVWLPVQKHARAAP